MAKSTNKTRPTEADVTAYLAAVKPEAKQADAEALCRLLELWSGETPRMWGPSMIGFGTYHYRYATGTEGDSFRVGFAPRAAAFSIYLMGTYFEHSTAAAEALFARLGKFTRGKACLYVKKLADIDLAVLEELVRLNLRALKVEYGWAS